MPYYVVEPLEVHLLFFIKVLQVVLLLIICRACRHVYEFLVAPIKGILSYV